MLFIYIDIYIYISKVKLATIVEGNPKAPFFDSYDTKM